MVKTEDNQVANQSAKFKTVRNVIAQIHFYVLPAQLIITLLIQLPPPIIINVHYVQQQFKIVLYVQIIKHAHNAFPPTIMLSLKDNVFNVLPTVYNVVMLQLVQNAKPDTMLIIQINVPHAQVTVQTVFLQLHVQHAKMDTSMEIMVHVILHFQDVKAVKAV